MGRLPTRTSKKNETQRPNSKPQNPRLHNQVALKEEAQLKITSASSGRGRTRSQNKLMSVTHERHQGPHPSYLFSKPSLRAVTVTRTLGCKSVNQSSNQSASKSTRDRTKTEIRKRVRSQREVLSATHMRKVEVQLSMVTGMQQQVPLPSTCF